MSVATLHREPITPETRFVTADIPYRVLSARGYVLGKFDRLQDAEAAYGTWAQASAIVLGNFVVCQRKVGAA